MDSRLEAGHLSATSEPALPALISRPGDNQVQIGMTAGDCSEGVDQHVGALLGMQPAEIQQEGGPAERRNGRVKSVELMPPR